MLSLFGAAFLGWSLGANDSANTFGTAVSSRMVSMKLAVVLIAVFVIVGAAMQGAHGIETVSTLSTQTMHTAILSSFAAAGTVTLMTILKLPVSTSQAVVGAILGVGLTAENDVAWSKLIKVLVCWIGTPIGAIICSVILWHLLRAIIRFWRPSIFVYDPAMRWALIVCGCYSAYALGANNVANVTAVFVSDDLNVSQAAMMGGIFIAAGSLTFGHRVMRTVGRGIVKLDAFAALVAVLSLAITVHVYAMIGVPVSTSQAIVGAVIGIGMINGLQTINTKALRRVCLGWVATPFVAAFVGSALFFLTHLSYQP
ncbi:MAG: inorganic phosphate transporter [Verrucomicrobia bacterium]|nr:inorganic phosphate transporter [Verrucomicrobiota bacterium]MDA1087780.1 inorganic phosphate transporter [Verrucomicrobiota bacterium]